jgi:hypothetical protein
VTLDYTVRGVLLHAKYLHQRGAKAQQDKNGTHHTNNDFNG